MVARGVNTKGRLERREIWSNEEGPGVHVKGGGDPTLVGCIIRDHRKSEREGSGCGLYVRTDAAGKATATGCVFVRNAGGDIVRKPPQQRGPAPPTRQPPREHRDPAAPLPQESPQQQGPAAAPQQAGRAPPPLERRHGPGALAAGLTTLAGGVVLAFMWVASRKR